MSNPEDGFNPGGSVTNSELGAEKAPEKRRLIPLRLDKKGVAALFLVGLAAARVAWETDNLIEVISEHPNIQKASEQVPETVQNLITPGNTVEFYSGTIRVPEADQLLTAPDENAPEIDPTSIDIRPQGEVLIFNPAVTQGPDGNTYLMGLTRVHPRYGDPQATIIGAVFVKSPDKPPVSHATIDGLQAGNQIHVQAHAGDGQEMQVGSVGKS